MNNTVDINNINDQELAAHIKDTALACGFNACGIIKVDELHGYGQVVDERIKRFPESSSMFSRMRAYAEPEKSAPWAKSIVICTAWYGKYRTPPHVQGFIGKYMCLDARKDARSAEYQTSENFENRLAEMGVRCATKNDFGVTAMRWAAVKSGIGIVRKNNFLYTEQGSLNSLWAYFIDRELELKAELNIKKCPENCGLCVKACPTGALAAPFQTNGVACVAYLNAFGTCVPGNELYAKCQGWVFGCDACQDACPFNRKAWTGTEDFPGLAELAAKLSYEQILSMNDDELRALLSEKFWYIKPEDAWKWRCNVLNAIRNNYDDKYLPYVERALDDERAEVRDMAQCVLESATSMSVTV